VFDLITSFRIKPLFVLLCFINLSTSCTSFTSTGPQPSDNALGSSTAKLTTLPGGNGNPLPPASAFSDAARAKLNIAEDAYNRGDWRAAVIGFKGLTDQFPRNPQFWFGYATSCALSGDESNAALGFETALSLDTNDVRSAYNLALIRLLQAGKALSAARTTGANIDPSIKAAIAKLTKELEPLFIIKEQSNLGLTTLPRLDKGIVAEVGTTNPKE
jgi:hypothetical protein